MAEKEVIEQEHVSENPENKKDTEHVVSPETEVKTTPEGIEYSVVEDEPVPPEGTKVKPEEISFDDLDPKIKEDLQKRINEKNDEMTPHEHSTEKTDGKISSIKTPEQIVAEEGDGTDIQIDMKEIEMDSDGIPVFTHEDANRLKSVELGVSDFEYIIKESRDLIFAVRNELDLNNQNIIETENKKLIENYKKSVDEINKRIEETGIINTEDEKSLKDLQTTIDILNDEIAHLPKYDKKVKLELERRELNAKKLIATYQNVSRKDIGKLQKDGTIAGLISASSNSIFTEAYLDSIRRSKNLPNLEDDESIKEIVNAKKNIEMEYRCFEYLDSAIKDIDNCELDFIIQHTKDLKNKSEKHSEEIEKAIDFKKIENIPELFKKLSDPMISEEDSNKYSKEYEDIKTSLITYEDDDKILSEIKEQRAIETRYIEKLELYTSASMRINQSFGMALKKPLKKLLPKIDEKSSYEEIDDIIDIIKGEYKIKWENISKEYEKYEDAIDEGKRKLIEPTKMYTRKFGLFNSFISYSFINSKLRGYYGRPESLLEIQHASLYGDKFYNLIRSHMNDNTQKEFDNQKVNINSVSMLFNNIIKYFCDLYEKKNDIEFAAQFDPDSNLKNFYERNKEKLDVYIGEYKKTINVLSHVIVHNQKFNMKYTKFISDAVDYINERDAKLKKLDEGKNVKNKFKFMTDVAFIYQFINSYKDFNAKLVDLNDAINKKRESDPKIEMKEFDKWYKENLLEKEHETTERVINSFVHALLGCNIVYAFDDLDTFFESKNKNKALKSDCLNYIFSEYVLESNAFRNCTEDKNYCDYIKERSKTVAYRSIDYSLQRDVNVEDARFETVTMLFAYISNTFKEIMTDICTPKEDDEKKGKKEKKEKKPQKSRDELIRDYKKKAKEKKRVLGIYKNAAKEYEHLVKHTQQDISYCVNGSKNVYNVKVFPSKDTKVIVRIERFAKSISETDVKKIFETAIIDEKKEFSIYNAFIGAKKISNDNLTNINEKWYYNQYVDKQFAIRGEEKLSAIDPNTYTLSERCRNAINECLFYAYDKIIESAITAIKNTGINFDGKNISIKNNCKFDIKYLKSNAQNIGDGNLNFFKAGIWDIITFELNYDIVNEKK